MPQVLHIDFEDMQIAFEDMQADGAWFLDTATGDVIRAHEDFEPDLLAEIEATEDRYINIPFQGSAVGYEDMWTFAETVVDPHLRGRLDRALSGKGAFRRFKDVLLDVPPERERWFAFQRARVAERIQRWARDEGFEAVARPRPSPR